ncbi:MAG: CDGSH iron-sulfur domain-containing protein [Pseudonocardiales bacterium]
MRPEPEAVITAYPDGPYLIRGAYRIVDANGDEVELTRRTVALCRCGRSSQKPWCDSSHKSFNFRDPAKTSRPPLARQQDSPDG